jgi:hypothetical protein
MWSEPLDRIGELDRIKRGKKSWVWLYMYIIPASGRQTQKDREFEAILGYTVSS